MNNKETNKIFLEFTNYLFYRNETSQIKANKLWNQIKENFPQEVARNFEIDWKHYLLNQLDYKGIEYAIENLKKFI